MQATQLLAGYTLGGADLLRRAMGKKKVSEMAKQRETFVKGCKEANDIPPAQANKVFDLLENEGLCLGGSSGINIAGAMHLARELGPNNTIVTILCDYGTRYQSKLYNPSFLKSKGLPVPEWLLETPINMPNVFEE